MSSSSTEKLLSPFHTGLFGRKSLCAFHPKGLSATSLKAEYLHKLFRILLNGKIFCSPSFVYSVICLYQHGLVDIYFIPWVVVQYYFIYFIAQIVPALAAGNSFGWFLCRFDICPSFFGRYTFLISVAKRFSRLLVYMSFPRPGIGHFSKELWFLLLENGIKKQDLGTRHTCCCCGLWLLEPLS